MARCPLDLEHLPFSSEEAGPLNWQVVLVGLGAIHALPLRRRGRLRDDAWLPIRRREYVCRYFFPQGAARGSRLCAELPKEDLLQTLVLAQSVPPMPTEGVQAHQPHVCLLANGVLRQYLPERLSRTIMVLSLLLKMCQTEQERDVNLPEPSSMFLGPLLVAVFR